MFPILDRHQDGTNLYTTSRVPLQPDMIERLVDTGDEKTQRFQRSASRVSPRKDLAAPRGPAGTSPVHAVAREPIVER